MHTLSFSLTKLKWFQSVALLYCQTNDMRLAYICLNKIAGPFTSPRNILMRNVWLVAVKILSPLHPPCFVKWSLINRLGFDLSPALIGVGSGRERASSWVRYWKVWPSPYFIYRCLRWLGERWRMWGVDSADGASIWGSKAVVGLTLCFWKKGSEKCDEQGEITWQKKGILQWHAENIGWVTSLFQGCGASASGLAWKATGLAELHFRCHSALWGVSERMVQVFKGGVPCTALKRGVPQARLRLKLKVEWGATPAAVSHSPCEFTWFWRVSCLEAPDLPSRRSAGVCRRADGNHLSRCRFFNLLCLRCFTCRCLCGVSAGNRFAVGWVGNVTRDNAGGWGLTPGRKGPRCVLRLEKMSHLPNLWFRLVFSGVFSFRWVGGLERQLPGSLANWWERDKCVWEGAVCLDEYSVGVMVETGDFCLVAPLCSLNWWRTGWRGFNRL